MDIVKTDFYGNYILLIFPGIILVLVQKNWVMLKTITLR